ncbi:MAG: DUF2163 domain-containing protein [Rhizobiales bacterium]|nr:DUF2163 domain-containing protein [Hyphomicrobiales bacterium]
MRTIPPALQDKLLSCVTGATLGFTDHDEDVTVGGTLCRAGTDLTGSEVTARLGLSVDGSEISGALHDDSLSEADLAAGRYDAAAVELFLVDWSEPSLFVLLSKGSIGEVRREGSAFSAEMRGPADRLNEPTGRLYTATCSADLGDGRCGIDLADARYRGFGTVATLDGVSRFFASGLDAFDDAWFAAGKLTWTSGANNGLAVEVKSHRVVEGGVLLTLWQAMPEPIAQGDMFGVTAGCDKRLETCRDRFGNVVNFRGFPHIPGNDFVARYAIAGEPGNAGRSLQQN